MNAPIYHITAIHNCKDTFSDGISSGMGGEDTGGKHNY